MTLHDCLHPVSRRDFFTSALSALGVVAFVSGCGRSESLPSGSFEIAPGEATPPPAVPGSSPAPPSRTIAINARVPEALVFPGPARSVGFAELTAIRSDPDHMAVIVHDSRGRSVTHDSAGCFANEIRKHGGKAGRRCLAPKILAAHILDGTRQTLVQRRRMLAFAKWQNARGAEPELVSELDALRQLEMDFAKLQEQAVLDNVSVGAVFAFLESIEPADRTLSRVAWDERDKRILVSFG